MNWRSLIPNGPPPPVQDAPYSDGYDDQPEMTVFCFRNKGVPAILTITVMEPMSPADALGAAYLIADESAEKLMDAIEEHRK